MSSPNPYPEDELNHLVRGALHARVGGREPSDRVWKQIRLELEADRRPPPPRSRVAWSPLGLQVALTLLLVMLGGVSLRTLLGPNSLRDSFYETSPSGTLAYVRESVAPAVTVFDDKAELRLLRADLGSRLETDSDILVPIVIPRDAPPNVLFSEGRVLDPEPSLSLIVNEQNPIRSGPYPWYR